MIIKGLKVTDNQIRYVFPRSLQPIKSFTSIQELGTILRSHFQQTGLPNFPYRHVSHNKGQVQCQFCPNTLIYELSDDGKNYVLKQCSIEHVHAKDADKHERYKQSWIKSYTDFKLAKNQIQTLLNKYSEKVDDGSSLNAQAEAFATFEEMITSFKKKKYFTYHEPEKLSHNQGYPNILLVVTPSMKEMYLRYGRCIGFDFTFNMVREVPTLGEGNKEQYLIGVIAGLNSFRRITIYGIVAVSKETPQIIQLIFTKFFEYTGKKPESIVTDQAVGMLSGIKRLQAKGIFTGGSYWDTFHVLKSYRFKTDELRRGIRHMVRQKCPYKFQKMYLQAVNIAACQDEMDSLHKFMHESQKYCMSQISPIFVGLGVSDTQNQIAHNVIKSQLPYQERYLNVVSKLVGFLDERNLLTSVCVRETCKIEDVIGQREYQILRLALPMKVHSFFYTQFYRATSIEILLVENNRTIFFVQDSETIYRVNLILYDPRKGTDQNRYRKLYECNCNFKNKTGVPCEHILKIAIIEKANILDQFDPYYVIQDPELMQACTMINNENKMDQKVRRRGRPAWRSVFYVERRNMERLPDKLSAVREKKEWVLPPKLEPEKESIVKPGKSQGESPEFAKGKFHKNRNEMMKRFYTEANDMF